jgi:hypothetical protein
MTAQEFVQLALRREEGEPLTALPGASGPESSTVAGRMLSRLGRGGMEWARNVGETVRGMTAGGGTSDINEPQAALTDRIVARDNARNQARFDRFYNRAATDVPLGNATPTRAEAQAASGPFSQPSSAPELKPAPWTQRSESLAAQLTDLADPLTYAPGGGRAAKAVLARLRGGVERMGERIADRVMVPSPGDAGKVKAGVLGAGGVGAAGYPEEGEGALLPSARIGRAAQITLERLRNQQGRTGDVSTVMESIQSHNLPKEVMRKRDEIARRSPEFSEAAPYLLPRQLERAVGDPEFTRNTYARDWPTLPPAEEMATVSRAGEPARGWYKGARSTIGSMFPDPNEQSRFAYGMASLSPQLPVEGNARNMIPSYFAWKKAGMPTDEESIHRILARNVQSLPILGDSAASERSLAQIRTLGRALGASPEMLAQHPHELRLALAVYEQSGPRAAMDVLKNSVLEAWRGNFTRAMRDERLISGPKVHNFGTDLDPQNPYAGLHFTGDTWDALLKGWQQKEKYGGQGFSVPRHDPGYSPGYSMSSAKTGQVADRLGWLPEEVQETGWSWIKPIGEGKSDIQVPKNVLQDVPTFQNLLRQPEFLKQMPADVRARLESASTPERSSNVLIPTPVDIRHLENARRRMERAADIRRVNKLRMND